MTDPVLTTHNLSIGYTPARRLPHLVAQDITVSLHRGELVCLLGPNGAGKSTLMRTLVGMQPPLEGQISLSGKDISELSARDIAQMLSVVLTDRISVGIISVRDLVALGRYPHTDWIGRVTDKDEEAVSWALQAAHAQDLAHRNVNELSDGERQKVMIARALAQQPELMILDEPTAFLDLPRRVEIMSLLQKLAHTTNKAILLSTHDLDLALRCADRIWLMPPESPLHIGAPEDLILNGSFELAFQSDGVHFDPDAGNFKMNAQLDQGKVSVSGQGRIDQWTRRALERTGFEIANDASDHHITIQDSIPPSWQIKKDEAVHKYTCIYDLIKALQTKSD